MKKRMALVMSLVAVTGLALSACGQDKNETAQTETTATSETTQTGVDTSNLDTEGSLSDLVLDDYVTLGEYKGLTVEVDPKEEISDEEIDDLINSYAERALSSENVLEEGTVKDGDVARIDYTGKKDGVAFDNGSATDYDLTIGSGTFIDGFESGLIGVNVGDTVTLDLTFPEEYSNEELAGQAVQFEVTVKGIVETVVEDLTDENASTVAQYMGLDSADSIEALTTEVKTTLQEYAESTYQTNKESGVTEAVYNNLTVKEVPEFLKNRMYLRISANYDSYAYSNFGVDAVTYYSYYGMDEASYTEYIFNIAEQYAAQYVAFQQIAEAEGLLVTDDDAKESAEAEYADYGYESADALLEDITLEAYKDDLMFKNVVAFLLENNTIVDKEETTETAETETVETEATEATEETAETEATEETAETTAN